MTDKELDNIEKWLAESFESFLREDLTRTTAESAKMAASYVVARFENLLSTSQREAEDLFDTAFEAGQDDVLLRQFENDPKTYQRYRARCIGQDSKGV